MIVNLIFCQGFSPENIYGLAQVVICDACKHWRPCSVSMCKNDSSSRRSSVLQWEVLIRILVYGMTEVSWGWMRPWRFVCCNGNVTINIPPVNNSDLIFYTSSVRADDVKCSEKVNNCCDIECYPHNNVFMALVPVLESDWRPRLNQHFQGLSRVYCMRPPLPWPYVVTFILLQVILIKETDQGYLYGYKKKKNIKRFN